LQRLKLDLNGCCDVSDEGIIGFYTEIRKVESLKSLDVAFGFSREITNDCFKGLGALAP